MSKFDTWNPSPEEAERVRLRLMSRVRVSGECWVWAGPTSTRGYGQMGVSGYPARVHRLAWRLNKGRIPKGLCVCHHCDNRPCVRPDHLFLATHQENMADMKRKGRAAKRLGSLSNSALLTEADVAEIKIRNHAGETSASIAKSFPVGRAAIDKIASGDNWSHVVVDLPGERAPRARAQVRGGANGQSKLTPGIVRAIRTKHAGGCTLTYLAGKYGVVPNSIRNVIIGATWKHV